VITSFYAQYDLSWLVTCLSALVVVGAIFIALLKVSLTVIVLFQVHFEN